MSNRSVAPISTRRMGGTRVSPRFGYLIEVSPRRFQLTTDAAEATAYWWDNGSGTFVTQDGVGWTEPESFASPILPSLAAPPTLARLGDLVLFRPGEGPFRAGPERPTRVAFVGVGPCMIATETV